LNGKREAAVGTRGGIAAPQCKPSAVAEKVLASIGAKFPGEDQSIEGSTYPGMGGGGKGCAEVGRGDPVPPVGPEVRQMAI